MPRWIYLSSVWLHVVAASLWVGGMIFFALVVVPNLRKPNLREHVQALLQPIAYRYRTIAWITLATLIVTGVCNVSGRGYGLEMWLTGAVFRGQWGGRLLHKLLLVGIILIMSGVHDFWIGPGASNTAHSPETREKFRRGASYFGRVNLLLSLAVLGLAILLVR